MAIARRVNTPAPPPPDTGGTVNFGSDGFFTGGLGLPEGNYAVVFHTQMFQPVDKTGKPSKTPAFLAVMGTFYPIDPKSGELIGEAQEHPLNCGRSAHESFVPSASGKGFDPVPNGKSVGMWNLSAFGIFFDSLKNSGLPPGLVTNDLSPLDGIWLHTQNIPEPEEKKAASKAARSKTGAAAMMGGAPEEERNRLVTVVSEILEGGKPWEGTGGIPEGAAEASKTAPKPVTGRPGLRAVAPVAAAAEEALDEESIGNAALAACSDVLAGSPTGMMKIALKTKAFEACKKAHGDEMAQAVMTAYLQTDEMLGAVLAELGFSIVGLKVAPTA